MSDSNINQQNGGGIQQVNPNYQSILSSNIGQKNIYRNGLNPIYIQQR